MRKNGLIVIAMMMACSVSHGQESAPPTDNGSAFIIVCDSNPSQIIVLDSQGRWIPEVRTAKVEVEFGKPAKITCVLWSGPFRPSSPETKIWTLAQMKSVSAQQFQGYVDQLQQNPQLNNSGSINSNTESLTEDGRLITIGRDE